MEVWKSGFEREALLLVSELNLQEEFEQTLNTIETLLKQDKKELIYRFVKGNQKLMKKAISLLCSHKDFELAKELIKKAKLDKREFPELITKMKQETMHYRLFSERRGLYHIIEITRYDAEMLSILISSYLSKGAFYIDLSKLSPWKQKLTAYLIQSYPETVHYLDPDLTKRLEALSFLPKFEIEDSFSPRNAIFNLILSVPEDSVYLIDSESQLKEIILQDKMIGLDSEWFPDMFETRVSILQIAEKDVRNI
jgi:hypothetical protein